MGYVYLVTGGIVVGLVGLFLTRFVKPEDHSPGSVANSTERRRI